MTTKVKTAVTNVRIGGTLVGYYLICQRKAWLSMHGLWMEQESEAVAVGRLIDQNSYARNKKGIMLTAEAPDGSYLVGQIDWANLREGVLHEVKKGRSCADAHVWQLRFYLWLLKRCGVTREDETSLRGQINYPKLRRSEPVMLTAEHEARLAEIITALRALAAQQRPPARIDRKAFCRQCAFEELCYG